MSGHGRFEQPAAVDNAQPACAAFSRRTWSCRTTLQNASLLIALRPSCASFREIRAQGKSAPGCFKSERLRLLGDQARSISNFVDNNFLDKGAVSDDMPWRGR